MRQDFKQTRARVRVTFMCVHAWLRVLKKRARLLCLEDLFAGTYD